LGASTAAVEEPYSDDPKGENRGILQIAPGEIRRAVGLAREAGFGVEAHTIGDWSARELVDAFEEHGVTSQDRYTMTHCQILNPKLMKRMAEMNVLEMLRKPEHAMKQLVKPRLTANGDRMENGLHVPSHVVEDSKLD